MKYLSYKSSYILKKFVSNELLYIQLRILLSNQTLKPMFRLKLMQLLNLVRYNHSKFKRRCVVTCFSKSFRRLSFSRITFREFASYGYFTGIRKSS